MADDSAVISSMIFKTIHYILVTIPIYYLVRKIFPRQLVNNRNELAKIQRDEYFQKLIAQSVEIEAENAKKEDNDLNRVKELEEICAKLSNQLDDTCDENDTKDKLEREVNLFTWRRKKLYMIESELPQIDIKDNIDELLKNLEGENQVLASSIEDHVTYSTISEPNDEVLKFLEKHDPDLSRDCIAKFYDKLLELKATNSPSEMQDFGQSEKTEMMNNLQIDKKKVELDLQKTKKRYEKEFNTLREARLNYICQICGSKNHLETLRRINELTEQLIIPSDSC